MYMSTVFLHYAFFIYVIRLLTFHVDDQALGIRLAGKMAEVDK